MAKQTHRTPKSARTPSNPSHPVPSASSRTSKGGAEGAGRDEPEKLDSPLKPLLWLLIPLIFILLYGFLSAH